MKRRRIVHLVTDTKSGPLARNRLWAYDVHALARLIGMSVDTVHRDIKSGALDPADLWSVLAWANTRKPKRQRKRRRAQARGADIPAT